MAKKKREIVIIMSCLALLIAALWFWAYLRPSNERREEWRQKITEKTERLERARQDALARQDRFETLTAREAELRVRWDEVARDLPNEFKDTAALRHIQQVIYPHTREIELDFNLSEQREGDELYSTVVTLRFETSYWQYLSILYNLVQGNLGNRVVVYRLEVSPLEESEYISMLRDREYGILMTDAFGHIPEHIREVLNDGNINPVGLQTFEVEMEVEYLSLLPGLMSESDLREAWEELDTPEVEGLE